MVTAIARTRLPANLEPIVIPDRVAARAVSRFKLNAAGCHISTYSTGSHGYAQIGWDEDGRHFGTTAHRAAWVSEHGQIPLGVTIDHHKCDESRCVRVDHLRALANTDNAARTSGRDWPLGLCAQGHPASERNWNAKKSYCRSCGREKYQRAKARRNRSTKA